MDFIRYLLNTNSIFAQEAQRRHKGHFAKTGSDAMTEKRDVGWMGRISDRDSSGEPAAGSWISIN
jgi:hypothetical protein